MTEPPSPPPGGWRERLRSLRARIAQARAFSLGVLAALAALLLYNAAFPAPRPLTAGQVGEVVAEAMASATPAPARSTLIYEAIRPSLVLVEAAGAEGGAESGLGSGVVASDAGVILTSLHVIAGSSAITVTFADGTRSPARVLAEEPAADIAVLQALAPPQPLVPATLGNPGAVRVGDEAYVVGHPLGLYASMSAGVVSGLDRSFRPPNSGQTLTGLIQVDAAVNPGNSGGPLLNRDGHVIGIVAGLVNPTRQEVFIGLGFAVPINVAGGAAGLPPY
ncbi:MAG TPA: trypsin-like peptidase domain-containing protein [Chloroflexaceae bacterium]|nr:trypsin-like peptidase domain-containing protein [Chloroflexaceae bacterium]